MNPTLLKSSHVACTGVLTAVALAILPAITAGAQDVLWQGSTATYNNTANWAGAVIPVGANNAVNNSGTNNRVQINSGDPNWTVNQIKAGNGTGDGAFEQNGQTVNLAGINPSATSYVTSLRLGITAGSLGVYTLNSGNLNYTNGSFNVGELGAGILNINGGTISGFGNFADGYGTAATPSSTTATMDGGLSNSGYTWFAQGFYTVNGAVGLPPAGSTFVSTNLSDHSYTMAPSYTTNNAIEIDSNYVTSATITLTTPAAYSALSFLGSAGNLAITVNYTVHHADSTIETGNITFPDWFATNAAAFATGGRVSADGKTFQIQSSGAPFLYSLDTTLTNTTSPVTSIDLTYASSVGAQSLACIMALSGSTGSGFNPITFTGYNEDMVVDASTASQGYSTQTSVVNQAAGAINITNTGQFFIGNYGPAIYNLSGGTIDVHNYIAFGRSGGNGTFNMTGGTLNQDGGGNLLIGTGFQAPSGGSAVGILNQGGGTINCTGQLLCPETSPSTGTYNISNNAVVYVHDWIAIGRTGGSGMLNISGNAVIVRDNANDATANFDVGGGGPGIVNQNGGAVTNAAGQTWIGESSSATWTLNSGIANLGTVHIGQVAGGSGTLRMNGGTLLVNELSTGNPADGSQIIFNGGTVIVTSNNATFMHDLTFVGLSTGGLTIDSQTNNITLSQEIDDSAGGGLTKNGSGTMTLTGPNTYVGDTLVNAGTLIVGTMAGSQSINYTVADTAGFGVIEQAANGQVSANTLTAGGATGGTLNFNLAAFGNPGSALLNVGTLTANGTFTVNISASVLAAGTIPLMQWSSLVGAPNIVLGTLPAGVAANLQITGNVLQLVVTSAGAPRWDGNATGMWDLGPNLDWYDLGTMSLTAYSDSHPVLFDDNAAGTTTVNLTATVTPLSIVVTNNTKPYVIAGSGKITGATGLAKSGSSSLSLLNTGNDYTGPTVVTGGTLVVTNISNGGSPSSIGASSANPTNFVFGNATVSYVGPTASANRGYKMTGNSTLDIEGNLTLSGQAQASAGTLTKVGPATMTYSGAVTNVLTPANVSGAYQINNGAVVFDGSSGVQSNSVIGELWVGANTNYAANLVLTNTTLGISSWFALGRGNGSNNLTSTTSLYNSWLTCANFSLGYANGLPNLARQIFNVNGTSTLTIAGTVNLSENAGSTALLNLNNTGTNSLSTSSGTTVVGGTGGVAGSAAINQTAGTVNFGNGGQYLTLGNGGVSTYGAYNLSGGTLNVIATTGNFNGIRVGFGGAGSFLQSGGVLNCARYLAVGGSTTNGNGVVTFTGGNAVFNPSYNIHLPDVAGATAIMNVGTEAGGSAFITHQSTTGITMINGGGATGTGILNLNSGTLLLGARIYNNGTGKAVVNLNGATLQFNGTGVKLLDPSLSSVNMFKGGLTMNIISTSSPVTSQANMLGALGNGIYPAGGTLTVSNNGGSGYVGAPLVTVTGGSGSNAMAIATISGGVVTNVVLTCPGQSYVAGDVINFAFIGGGSVTPAGTFSYTLQAGDLAANAGGGLTKTGVGTLYLNGVNTYTGTTLISAGTLSGAGTVSGPVNVASGGTLTVGAGAIGTWNVNNSLTLAAGSTNIMKIGASSNDQISGLTSANYYGALIVTNTTATPLTAGAVYQLFNSGTAGTGSFSSITILPATGLTGTFNPATGQLTITSTATTPIALNPVTTSGGNLILTGTGGAANGGYTVLQTTNLLTPLANWTTNLQGTLSGTGSLSNAIPVNTTMPAQFFRVRQP